jgi:catechol 2,3-dioxygenase-like lactoylglutathione lyase family enzyme
MTRSTGVLHHLELYVRDLERSAEFWGWLLTELGYEPFQEWDEGISWRVPGPGGGAYLALVQAPDGAADLDRRSVGLNHVAFAAADRDTVDMLTERLQAMHVRVLYPDRHPYAGGPDHYAVFFEDPDGLKVEVTAG